jgi:T5SS/PEP-CTERM-associated repeat protein
MRRSKLLCVCGCTIALLIGAKPALAASISWNTAVNGDFGTGASWTGGIAPGGADTAIFNVNGTYVVSFANTQDTTGLNALNGTVLFGMNGQTYVVSGTSNIGTTSAQSATLQLLNGTIELGGQVNIGSGGSGVSGKLIVDSDATFNGKSALVGTTTASSTGAITVQNGGQFLMSSSLTLGNTASTSGTLTVSRTGSAATVNGLALVGSSGDGELDVQNDAVFNQTSTLTIANGAGSSGTIGISGLGTPTLNVQNSSITFGSGSGQILVNAGQLNVSGSNTAILLVANAGGSANLTVGGGTVNATSLLGGISIGNSGSLILNSGAVNTTNLTRTTGTLTLNDGTLTVAGTFTNGSAVTALTLNGLNSSSRPALVLSGSAATTSNVGNLNVGTSQFATLTIQNGATFSDIQAVLGSASAGNGTVNVTGTGSTWTNSSFLTVGSSGTGLVTVSNGGQATSVGTAILGQLGTGKGTVTVTGSGSKWSSSTNVTVGASGTGMLNILAGGLVTTTTDSTIASSSGSVGAATVGGAGSTWTNTGGGLFIGGNAGTAGGTGSLTINNGGTVNVSGQTKIWNFAGSLTINGGTLNTGSFTRLNTFVFNDGLLIASVGVFNYGSAATNLTLDGNTSTALPTLQLLNSATTSNIANLAVGNVNQGALVINSAILTANGNVTIGGGFGTTSTVTVSGTTPSGILNLAGPLTVGSLSGGMGILNVNLGGIVSGATALNLNPGGTVNLNGGQLNIQSLNAAGGVFNFNSGTVSFSSATLSAAQLTAILGPAHNIVAGQNLAGSSGILTLGDNLNVSGGSLSAVTLQNNATLQVTQGTVSGSTAISNSGSILLSGNLAVLSGGTLTNNSGGLISGTGAVNNNFTNASGGTVRATGSERLVFTGATNTNSGNFDLVGGTIEFRQSFANSAGAAVSGYGNLTTSSASPGGLGITNSGIMQFSGGNTNVRGDLANNVGGQVFTAGGTVTTFFDDVANDGSIFTNVGARAVFFGLYSGGGSLPGGGTNEFVGDTRPGNSPASIQIGGSAVFDSTAKLFIELGGTNVGAQYDKVSVAGQLSLAGTLNVSLINSFSPQAGNKFDILDWGSLNGTFATVQLPALPAPLAWNTSQLYQTGILAVNDTNFGGNLGDIDRDTHVNIADVSALESALVDLSTYQSTHGPGGGALSGGQMLQIADLTGDNLVNNLDLQGLINYLANNAGALPAPGGGSITAVPEPASLILAVTGLATLMGLRRCRFEHPLNMHGLFAGAPFRAHLLPLASP